MIWKSRPSKIANKVLCTPGEWIKRYWHCCSDIEVCFFILSHLHFGIIFEFEWNRTFKLKKKRSEIYDKQFNNPSEPIFKNLKMLTIEDIFNIPCLEVWLRIKKQLQFCDQFWDTIMNFIMSGPEMETSSIFSPQVDLTFQNYWSISIRTTELLA